MAELCSHRRRDVLLRAGDALWIFQKHFDYKCFVGRGRKKSLRGQIRSEKRDKDTEHEWETTLMTTQLSISVGLVFIFYLFDSSEGDSDMQRFIQKHLLQ